MYKRQVFYNDKYDWVAVSGVNGGRVYCIVCANTCQNHGWPLHFVDESILDYHASTKSHEKQMQLAKGTFDESDTSDTDDDASIPPAALQFS